AVCPSLECCSLVHIPGALLAAGQEVGGRDALDGNPVRHQVFERLLCAVLVRLGLLDSLIPPCRPAVGMTSFVLGAGLGRGIATK
uniref:hypothetical protein n=1 Tax=Alcaligenes xylosoxydans xylosoxydans TaxID=85698 RepID=UPI001F147A05